MDPNQPNSFINLLTEDSGTNAPNYPPNWQYLPPPYPLPQQNAYYPPYPPPQQNAYFPPPQNAPNFAYGALPPPIPPQGTPPPQLENNHKNNEVGDTALKWILEEDRRLVKS